MEQEQEERLQALFADLEAGVKYLSDWEKNFLSDHIERYQKYGNDIRLSPKQWAVLEKMHEKVAGK